MSKRRKGFPSETQVKRGVRIVHMVTTPSSPLRRAATLIGPRFKAPFSREPYYLIARALGEDTPRVLFDLDRWDCVGGDILGQAQCRRLRRPGHSPASGCWT